MAFGSTTSIPLNLHAGGFVPNLPGLAMRVFQFTSVVGDNDLGSPASGKRWIPVSFINQNQIGTTVQWYYQFKTGGTTYKTLLATTNSGSQTIATNTGQYFPVLESTDTLSVNYSNAGIFCTLYVLEFTTSSNVRSQKYLSLATGNNTIYTCPSNKTALSVTASWNNWVASSFGVFYINQSSASRAIYFNTVPNGGSPIAPGGANSNADRATATNATNLGATPYGASWAVAFQSSWSLNLNVDSGVASQYGWVTVIEV